MIRLKTIFKNKLLPFGCICLALQLIVGNVHGQFTAKNLTVLQLGVGGSTALSSAGTPIKLVEYTTSGSATGVSVSLPSSSTPCITESGTATSEGGLSLSSNHDRLVIAGYNATSGTAGVASSTSISRVIYTVSSNGTITAGATSSTAYSGNNIRCGTADGTNYFGAGTATTQGGIELMNSTTQLAATPTNTRCVQIINGQLYFSASTTGFIGVCSMGTGIPTTSGQTATNLMSGTTVSPSSYGFSISPDGNTMYIADDGAGIIKCTKSGSTFSRTYVLNTTNCRGIAVDYSGSQPVIYATTSTLTSANTIIKVIDAGSAGATATTIATAPTNTVFRGLTFTPFTASFGSSSTSVCSGGSTNVILNGTPGSTVAYTINGGTTLYYTFTSSGTTTLSTGTLSSTATYSLLAVSDGLTTQSLSGVSPVVITVNTPPTITSADVSSTNLCQGSTLNLTGNVTGATTYLWNGPGGYTSTLQSPSLTTSSTSGGVYTFTATSSTGCSATSYSSSVSISTPETVIASASPNPVCVGGNITLNGSHISGATYSWSGPEMYSASVQNPSAFTTDGGSGGIYTLTVVTGPCTIIATTTVTVSTPATGILANLGSNPVCIGSNLTLNAIATGATAYSWSGPEMYASSMQNPTPFAMDGGSGGVYTLTVWSGACSSTAYTPSVIISTPATGVTASASPIPVCSGSNLTLSGSASGATSFSWSGPSGYSATDQNPSAITANSGSAGTYMFTAYSGACATTVSTSAVTVTPLPYAGTITGAVDLCPGATLALSDVVSGGNWSSSNTAIATIDVSGIVTAVANGTVTIYYTYTNACGTDVASTTINVTSVPSAGTITGPSTICSGATSTLVNGLSGGTWSTDDATIEWVDIYTGEIYGAGLGSTNIHYTITNSCGSASTSYAVSVIGIPSAPSGITGSANVCSGSTITLSDISTGGAWSSSNTSIATVGSTGIVNGLSVGTVNILYTLSNMCGSSNATATINVNTVPSTPSSILGTSAVCVGATISLSDMTSGGSWTSSNTSIASVDGSGVVLGVATGTININYTLTNDCGSTSITMPVIVNDVPALPLSISGANNVCTGANTTLSDATTGGVWSSSNSTLATVGSTTGIVHGVATGTATIYYTVSNSCGPTSVNSSVTVNAIPATPDAISGSNTVCTGANTTLSSTTTGGMWSSSNTAKATVGSLSGIVSGVATGTANIVYTVTNSCGSSTASSSITVNTVPSVSAIGTGTLSTNIGGSVTLSDATTGGVWSSSSSSIASVGSTTGVVVANAAGIATITYTVSNSCGSSIVTAAFNVAAAFTPGNLAVFEVGGGTGTSGPISIVEFNTTTPNQTTPVSINNLPTSGTLQISASGSATSEGAISLDAERTHLIVPGYNAPVGTASITGTSGATVNRELFTLDNTNSYALAYKQNVFSANNIRGGTANGTNYYASGANTGIILMNGTSSTVSTTVTNTRYINIINGQLYFTTSSTAGVYKVGSGIPVTTGNTSTIVSTSGGSTSSPYGFTISPDNNTMYIADDNTTVGGIKKYTRTGGTGTFAYQYNVTNILCRGLTADFSTTPYTLYATTSAALDSVIKVSDNGAGSTVTVLAVAPTGKAFRGVTFTPSNNAVITGANAICTGASDNVTIFSNPNATVTYNINGGTNQTITVGSNGTAVISDVLSNSTSAPITYTYNLVSVTSSIGTTSVTGNTTITVNPLPAVNSITGTSSLCSGTTISLSDLTTGGSWYSSSTFNASVDISGNVTGAVDGTVTIYYSVSNACGNTTVSYDITVNPLPDAGSIDGSGASSICPGEMTTFSSDVTPDGVWSIDNTSVATVDGSGNVTGVASGVATIAYTYTNSCGTNIAYSTITINSLPIAGTISGTTTICELATSTFSATISGGSWSVNNANATVVDGLVSAVTAGTSTISYGISNSCGTAYATQDITINPLPVAGTIVGTFTVCPGGTVSLSNSIMGGTWGSSNSNSTVSSSGLVTGVLAGTSTINYNVTNSCGSANAVQDITINPLPNPGMISGVTVLCPSTSTLLSDVISGGTWSSSNTSIATIDGTGNVTGVAAGTTTINYAVTNGCGSANTTTTVTVNPLPVASAISGGSYVTAGTTMTVSDATVGGTWSSSNTTIATVGSTGVVNGVSVGSANIVYTVTNSCGNNSATKTITVNAAVTSILGATTVCNGSSISLSDLTIGGTWSSSNTTIATVGSTTGIVSGLSAGVATISYNYFGSIATRTIIVNSSPAAITGASSICSIAATTLHETSSGGSWSSSNTSFATVSSTGIVNGVSAGTVNISYVLTNGCYAIMAETINAAPVISGSSQICKGSSYTLSTTISGGTWGSTNNGIASVGSTGIVLGNAVGSASINYTISGCGSATLPVTVNAQPAAITGTNYICTYAPTTLSDITTGGNWSSSNTSIATIGSVSGIVTGIAPGTVIIYYTEPVHGCSIGYTEYINGASAITGTSTSVCPTATLSLTDAVTGGTWSSSATGIATVNTSGVVTGVAGGTVNINYTKSACIVSYPITVNAAPTAILGVHAICSGASSITLSDATSGGTWLSSNTGVATIGSTGVVNAVSFGTATISYTLSSGCYVTAIQSVNATPNAITGNSSLCPSGTSTLSSTTIGGTWASSSTTIANINTSGLVTAGASAGSATISYSMGGCSTINVITVNANPSMITGASSVCSGQSSTYSDVTTGGVWSSGTPSIASIGSTTGILTAISGGTTVLTYTGANGCKVTGNVTIGQTPTAIMGGTTVCLHSSTTFSDALAGGTWSSVNPTIATVGSTTGIITPVAGGVAVIKYTIGYCPASKNISVNSGCREGSATSEEEVKNEYTLYPNPTSGNLNITQSVINDGYVSVKLINYTGATVYNGNVEFKNGTAQLTIADIVPGIYLLGILNTDGEMTTFRVVVEK